MRLRYLILLSLLVLNLGISRAQSLSAMLGLEESGPAVAVEMSDSAKLALAEQALDEARLSEANLRLELEHLRIETQQSDSLRRARLRARIDSLRSTTVGSMVVVEDDTLFALYAKSGGWSAEARAEMAANVIEKLGKSFNVRPDSVYIESSDILTDLMYGQEVIVSFSDRDGLWAGCSRDSLAASTRDIVVQKLQQMKQEHGLWQLIRRTVLTLLVIIALIVLFKLINRGFRRVSALAKDYVSTHLQPFYIHNFELLDVNKQVRIVQFLVNLLRYVVLFLVLVLTVPLIFSLFPQTKDLAYKILSYILDPAYEILKSVIAYIPNLFTIIVIWLAIYYLVKLVRYLAQEVEQEHLKINGFYPDWAMPTYNIIRFLLYAFMIAMIYPYLPGSNSGIFQGVSVFLGLIVSLGSSTVIGNIIAGLVITYMRPFKMGDRIKLNDTTGNVIEKTPLVTRIRTPKNEVVTVPNSFIMSSQTINYSQSAREFGLIIHTEVTIGYDVPWRQINKLLIEAALNTPGVVDDPRPFVLETSLSDWYPVYQLNAYIRDANRIGDIYSDLHQNIQDAFNAAGVEIMSPHYMATRDGNESTIPKRKE